MTLLQAVLLGIVEGVTEFLPVSSTGHLTLAEVLLGVDPASAQVTGFTAVVQAGAVLAVIAHFQVDLRALAVAGVRGLTDAQVRGSEHGRMARWLVVATLPIATVGLLARPWIEGPQRSLWWVGAGLIGWSAVMWWAERRPQEGRTAERATTREAVLIGLGQCAALIPGVSRSGAAISVGLLTGLSRVAATRLSFPLAVPALTAATALELPSALGTPGSVAPLAAGSLAAFVVAYATIRWLLGFVAERSIAAFVPYRLAAGVMVLGLAWSAGSG